MARPVLQPTVEQRLLVKSFAAVGIPQEQIARKIGMRSPKTLRKYYREELELGAIEANYSVSQTLHKMATSGKSPAATIFWLKSRAHWRERSAVNPTAVAPPPFVVALDTEPVPPIKDSAHDPT